VSRLFKPLVACLGIVLGLSAAVDWRVGDARFALGNWTVRHWDFVPAVTRACAFPELSGGSYPCVSPGATTYTLSGPSSLVFAATSSAFTETPVGSVTTSTTVTPSDSSNNGIFSPTTDTLLGTAAATFTYTPLRSGSFTISTSNNGGLTDPAGVGVAISNSEPGYPSFASGWGSADAAVGSSISDPFGGSAAISLTEDTSNTSHEIEESAFTDIANTQRTISVMIKNGAGTRNINLALRANGGGSGFGCVFSTAGAVVLSYSFGGSTFASTNSSSSGLASGWTLVQVTGTVGTATSVFTTINIDSGTSDSYTGDGVSNVLLYGAVRQ
jgi:hypothetical protein